LDKHSGMSPLIPIFAINLLPVFSVALFGWSAFTLVLLYWIENVIVGVFNVFKILIAGFAAGRAGALTSLVLTPFFIFHYGMFCFVHGIFICLLFTIGTDTAAQAVNSPIDLVALVIQRLHGDKILFWNVILIGAFHLFIFLRYWVGTARWRVVDPATQMFAPYARIVVVHLTIMIGAIPVILLGQPMYAVLCLALLKTGMETGRMRLFSALAENPALAAKMRQMLMTWDHHARH